MKWTAQEVELLKALREKQGKNNWEKIAQDLNLLIGNNFKKTSRQCRDKYVHFIKIKFDQKDGQSWTLSQEKFLIQLYLKFGPSWLNFQQYFPKKTLINIKNKFYNSLRKTARQLASYQIKNFKDNRNPITYKNMIAILQLSSRLRKWAIQNNYQESSNSRILSLSKLILQKSFSKQNFENEVLLKEIITEIKILSSKLKCLKIFKIGVKLRKQWKLSDKKLRFILENDNTIQSQQVVMKQLTGKQFKQNQKKMCQSNSNHQDIQSLDLQQQQIFLNIQFSKFEQNILYPENYYLEQIQK